MEEEIEKSLLSVHKAGFEMCMKAIKEMADATENPDIHNSYEALIVCLENLKDGIYGENK